MQFKTLFLTLIPAAMAHFHLTYPLWRADSLALATNNQSISQWFYPCAGIGQETSANNRTAWPLDGGSVVWNSSHPDALTTINLGLGAAVTTFNISLIPMYNETGAGQTCLSKVGQSKLSPLNITDGTQASIQVITISSTGAALYNCADIVFRKNATVLDSGSCKNDTGVSGSAIVNANAGNSSEGSGSSGNSTTKGSGAIKGSVPVAALFAAVGAGMYASL
ncbi:hypothetical protein BT63DRAFT_237137 [Microthyrium microscopicum]|uniref:Copper acquisition factor BIM1-like domain-containing protein n=1 Tax=Microthyrium microscopicum TaxID=703497 RepID=A0A6A6UG32_9PEZI|nr:hypothetical protein BT63DRAFT_237137 [Microthyrium microscopicum]